MNQSLKLPMLGCDDASSVTDAAFGFVVIMCSAKLLTDHGKA